MKKLMQDRIRKEHKALCSLYDGLKESPYSSRKNLQEKSGIDAHTFCALTRLNYVISTKATPENGRRRNLYTWNARRPDFGLTIDVINERTKHQSKLYIKKKKKRAVVVVQKPGFAQRENRGVRDREALLVTHVENGYFYIGIKNELRPLVKDILTKELIDMVF